VVAALIIQKAYIFYFSCLGKLSCGGKEEQGKRTVFMLCDNVPADVIFSQNSKTAYCPYRVSKVPLV